MRIQRFYETLTPLNPHGVVEDELSRYHSLIGEIRNICNDFTDNGYTFRYTSSYQKSFLIVLAPSKTINWQEGPSSTKNDVESLVVPAKDKLKVISTFVDNYEELRDRIYDLDEAGRIRLSRFQVFPITYTIQFQAYFIK